MRLVNILCLCSCQIYTLGFCSGSRNLKKGFVFLDLHLMSLGGFFGSGGGGGAGDAGLLFDSLYITNNMNIASIPQHHLLSPPIVQPVFNSSALSLALVCTLFHTLHIYWLYLCILIPQWFSYFASFIIFVVLFMLFYLCHMMY